MISSIFLIHGWLDDFIHQKKHEHDTFFEKYHENPIPIFLMRMFQPCWIPGESIESIVPWMTPGAAPPCCAPPPAPPRCSQSSPWPTPALPRGSLGRHGMPRCWPMMAYSHGPMVTLRRLEWEATMGHDGNRALEIPWKLRCNGKSFGNHQSWMETLETWRSYRGNTGKHTLGTSWEKFFFWGGGSIRENLQERPTHPSFLQLSPFHPTSAKLCQGVPSFISSNGAQKPSSGAHFVKARCGWTRPSTVN